MLSIDEMPRNFMGGTKLPTGDGLGFDIRIQSIERDAGTSTAQLMGVYALFVDPPTIQLTNTFSGELDLIRKRVQIRSDSGQFTIDAQLSEDLQTIEGKADIPDFQLMDVAGSFLEQSISLEAYEEEP